MLSSRRNFFRTLSVGAVASAAAHWPLGEFAHATPFEPARTNDAHGAVRLNSNENPYGPPPRAVAVIRSAIASSNRYPFMDYEPLAQRIADFHHVNREQVLFGCGSSEILRVAAFAYLAPGKRLIQPSPTFEVMDHYARSMGAEVISVPLAKTFAHDLEAMLTHTDTSGGLIYICNPNNPTASLTPRQDLEAFISKLPAAYYVLVDEAYHHFAGESGMYKSFIEQPVQDERVIVSRTFSKIYGMAGLRLGYGVASPATAKRLASLLTSDGVNGIVSKAAIAALDDTDSVRLFVKRNADVRQEFFNQAMARMLKPIDSHTNFVMMNTYHPAEEMIEHFRKQNVLIGRRFPAMDTYIRVSLGTPEEMKAFWQAWDKLHLDLSMHH
jgi:histidinol-phosphate aminotransferase